MLIKTSWPARLRIPFRQWNAHWHTFYTLHLPTCHCYGCVPSRSSLRRPWTMGMTAMFITLETEQNHFRDLIYNFSQSHSASVSTVPGVSAEFTYSNTESTLIQELNPVSKNTFISKPEIVYATRCPDERKPVVAKNGCIAASCSLNAANRCRTFTGCLRT